MDNDSDALRTSDDPLKSPLDGPRARHRSNERITDGQLRQYREYVSLGASIGVGGAMLEQLLDEIDRLRERVIVPPADSSGYLQAVMADSRRGIEVRTNAPPSEQHDYYTDSAISVLLDEIDRLRSAIDLIKANAITREDYALTGPAGALMRARAMAEIADAALRGEKP